MDHRKSNQSENFQNRTSKAFELNTEIRNRDSSSDEESIILDEMQSKVETNARPSRLEILAPSLIDDEIILVDEVLHQNVVQISKSVVLNVEEHDRAITALLSYSTVSDTRNSIESIESNKNAATEIAQMNEEHLTSTVQDTIKEYAQYHPHKVRSDNSFTQREVAVEEHLINNSKGKQERTNEETTTEELSQIFVGIETPELHEEAHERISVAEERNSETKSDMNLIKAISSRSLNETDDGIRDTFFEDSHIHVIDSFKEFKELVGSDDRPLPDGSVDSNYPFAEQRGSEATAVKFMISVSEHTLSFASPRRRDKKSKSGKGAKRVAYKRPSCADESVRNSETSTVSSTSTFMSKMKSLIIDSEQDDKDADDEKRRTKLAMVMRRISLRPVDIVYKFEGRIGEIDDAMESWYNFDDPSDETNELQLSQAPDEVMEETTTSEEEIEENRLDREPYFLRYENAMGIQKNLKKKNFIFQKYITMYFRRRKVANFLMDSEPPLEQVNKYNQKLVAYGELRKIQNEKRLVAENETNFLKNSKESKFLKCVKMFDDYQNHEEIIGRGLIHTKTGKSLPDKIVERYIRRQRSTMSILCRMRLEFIKLRSMLFEKNKALDSLDEVTPTRRLVEYEQLKQENRGLADRIEEKETELVRVRSKCQNTIQILAHLREKSAALEVDVNELTEDLNMVKLVARAHREAVNALRQHKTEIRAKMNKLKEESGLLTEPILLHDMDETQKEVSDLTQKIYELKEDVETRTKEIENIKHNLQETKELFIKQRNCMYPISLYSKSLSHEISLKSTNSLRPKLFNKSGVSVMSRTSRRSRVNLLGQVKRDRHENALLRKSDKVAFDDLVRIKAPSTITMKKKSRSHLFNY